jgi:hypothetical protein
MSRDQYLDYYQYRACMDKGACSPVVAITVRSAVEVFDDGRDSNGVEAQLLNVVEVV